MASLLSIPNLLVLHLNSSLLVSQTALQPMFDDGRVNQTCCKTIHYSDIFRMAAIYRYGFTVCLLPLTIFSGMVVGTQIKTLLQWLEQITWRIWWHLVELL